MLEEKIRKQEFAEISGSHGGEYKDDCVLGCCVHVACRLLPPSSGALMMEAVSTSETLVNFYKATWRYFGKEVAVLCQLHRLPSWSVAQETNLPQESSS
jgi:hypothetical protein